LPKRSRKSLRKPRSGSRPLQRGTISPTLQARLDEAVHLLEHGQPDKAVNLLEPLCEKHPRQAPLHHTLGVAYAAVGALWRSLDALERAFELSPNMAYLESLASLYLQLEMTAHALDAFRRLLRSASGDATETGHAEFSISSLRGVMDSLEHRIRLAADALSIPAARVERGLLELEHGNQTLQRGDYSACIKANRRAVNLLGDWPPPHNNLSLALFYSGSPKEAIATERQVLERNPANVQALSNLCRFLAWTGQTEQAQSVWAQLKTLRPANASECLKMAEAAATLEDDQAVYDLLRPWAEPRLQDEIPPSVLPYATFLLGVAEANLGKAEARRRFEAVQDLMSGAPHLLEAVKAGQPGPGFASRYPYFSVSEMLPAHYLPELLALVGGKDTLTDEQFRRQMDGFLARFPQTVLVAEKLLWEEEQAEAGMLLLEAIGTPSAYAALRRFAVSQAGEDSVRIKALHALVEAGVIDPSHTLRVWAQGEWRDVQLHTYEISEPERPDDDPEVAHLMSRGEEALEAGDDKHAVDLFRRALERDPNVKEAYNNLGAIYARRGDHSKAKQMFHAALEIDPTYVFPLCNLVVYLLDDDDLDAAEAMLQPLADRPQFRPMEMAFYSYLQARLAIARENYGAARNALEMALQVVPDYAPAREMQQQLNAFPGLPESLVAYREREDRRKKTRRRRLQSQLSTRDPRLGDALSLYTRELLTSMGRVIWPHKGWSGLRKADLLSELVKALQSPEAIDHILDGLTKEERTAVLSLLSQGGHMPWLDFDARFGNDMDASPYWQWHQPTTTMGRLRQRGLLVEATVDGELLVIIPLELRQPLAARLGFAD